jgi:hypothetical protein
MTRTMKNDKTVNKKISLKYPQRGKEQGMAGHSPPARTTQQKRGGD